MWTQTTRKLSRRGFHGGVDTPTLQSPGVWPLKSELIGEEWDAVEQRLEAGFPGAGTHAGDQLHTAAQLVGSDRPSTLPLFQKLSLEDAL